VGGGGRSRGGAADSAACAGAWQRLGGELEGGAAACDRAAGTLEGAAVASDRLNGRVAQAAGDVSAALAGARRLLEGSPLDAAAAAAALRQLLLALQMLEQVLE